MAERSHLHSSNCRTSATGKLARIAEEIARIVTCPSPVTRKWYQAAALCCCGRLEIFSDPAPDESSAAQAHAAGNRRARSSARASASDRFLPIAMRSGGPCWVGRSANPAWPPKLPPMHRFRPDHGGTKPVISRKNVSFRYTKYRTVRDLHYQGCIKLT